MPYNEKLADRIREAIADAGGCLVHPSDVGSIVYRATMVVTD